MQTDATYCGWVMWSMGYVLKTYTFTRWTSGQLLVVDHTYTLHLGWCVHGNKDHVAFRDVLLRFSRKEKVSAASSEDDLQSVASHGKVDHRQLELPHKHKKNKT